ncbi:unnamed protein product [Amaranthus hypochondriacus]
MEMELPYAYNKHNNLHVFHGGQDYSSRFFVIVRHSESRTLLKILAQALILALIIMVLAGVFGPGPGPIPGPGSTTKEFDTDTFTPSNQNQNSINAIPLVFQDLAKQRLWTLKDESLIVSNYKEEKLIIEMKTMSPSDTLLETSIQNETFDFSFTDSFGEGVGSFLDRILKMGGIILVQLSPDPSMSFEVPPNYKIVYFRKLHNSTFIAMRKIAYANTLPLSTSSSSSMTQRKLLEFLSEEKKKVLGNLEDVLLEPPRSATGKSKTYLRKTKFLPDLLNDSLEGYSRRVYIDVGGGHGSTRWFEQNYPTRNKDFDMYRIETVPETEVESDDAWEGPPTQMGISDWLWRNVKAEEYVVMKADAEVVEEMLKSKAIGLVDELFLECKPIGKGGNSKRAYWECLALYGRLRDFGVAVHQWWG